MNAERPNPLDRNNGYTLILLSVISVALLLASCGRPYYTHYRMYSGDGLPKDQVAFIMEAYGVDIHWVDGQNVGATTIELLPGYHTISVAYFRSGIGYTDGETTYRETTYSKNLLTLNFYAEKGHSYLIVPNLYDNNRKWAPSIKDITRYPRYRMYSGDGLPKDQVAFITEGVSVRIHLVDEKEVYATTIELLPGYHTIEVAHRPINTERSSVMFRTLKFYAEKGHSYVIQPNFSNTIIPNYMSNYKKWDPYIKDMSHKVLYTDKDVYKHGEKITVNFSNAPGINSDWICIIPAGSPDTDAGDFKYTPEGIRQGSLYFDTPPPGKYEVRAYFDYNLVGYNISERYFFSVVGSP